MALGGGLVAGDGEPRGRGGGRRGLRNTARQRSHCRTNPSRSHPLPTQAGLTLGRGRLGGRACLREERHSQPLGSLAGVSSLLKGRSNADGAILPGRAPPPSRESLVDSAPGRAPPGGRGRGGRPSAAALHEGVNSKNHIYYKI